MRGIVNKHGHSKSTLNTNMRSKGQIWVETVIYTLIGLSIIGLVLATALPAINQKQDEVVIEQSIEALGNIDDKIYEVQKATGNVRTVNLEIRKGSLIVDTKENTISWILDSSYAYSQEGMWVPKGGVDVMTTAGNPWVIELKLNYSVDIRFNGKTVDRKELTAAPTAYKLMIENAGNDPDTNNTIIDIRDG